MKWMNAFDKNFAYFYKIKWFLILKLSKNVNTKFFQSIQYLCKKFFEKSSHFLTQQNGLKNLNLATCVPFAFKKYKKIFKPGHFSAKTILILYTQT